jgi:ADP-ribosyl-[dinitrogen reductase] hydrolase
MRLAPVALFYYPDGAECGRQAAASSRTTHGAVEAVECCRLLAHVLVRVLNGVDKQELLAATPDDFDTSAVQRLCATRYESLARASVKGSGYCTESLGAALWSFSTTDDFASAILAAVNLGDDADTTGAICGQIADAYYGVNAIPGSWRSRLTMADHIDATALRLLERAQR